MTDRISSAETRQATRRRVAEIIGGTRAYLMDLRRARPASTDDARSPGSEDEMLIDPAPTDEDPPSVEAAFSEPILDMEDPPLDPPLDDEPLVTAAADGSGRRWAPGAGRLLLRRFARERADRQTITAPPVADSVEERAAFGEDAIEADPEGLGTGDAALQDLPDVEIDRDADADEDDRDLPAELAAAPIGNTLVAFEAPRRQSDEPDHSSQAYAAYEFDSVVGAILTTGSVEILHPDLDRIIRAVDEARCFEQQSRDDGDTAVGSAPPDPVSIDQSDTLNGPPADLMDDAAETLGAATISAGADPAAIVRAMGGPAASDERLNEAEPWTKPESPEEVAAAAHSTAAPDAIETMILEDPSVDAGGVDEPFDEEAFLNEATGEARLGIAVENIEPLAAPEHEEDTPPVGQTASVVGFSATPDQPPEDFDTEEIEDEVMAAVAAAPDAPSPVIDHPATSSRTDWRDGVGSNQDPRSNEPVPSSASSSPAMVAAAALPGRTVPESFADHDLAQIGGIGSGMIKRLRQCGVTRVGELALIDPDLLRDRLGDVARLANVVAWIDRANRLIDGLISEERS